MQDNFVLNKFQNEMHKRGEDPIDTNNPTYPTFDSFNLMKHLSHVATNALFLVYFEEKKNGRHS